MGKGLKNPGTSLEVTGRVMKGQRRGLEGLRGVLEVQKTNLVGHEM